MLTVGDKLPGFSLQAVVGDKVAEFKRIGSDSFPGKWLVLFLWPMDFTFVCPTEIAEFGRKSRDFAERGAQVLGGSTDSHFVHLAWRKDHPDLRELPFPMLADTSTSCRARWGSCTRRTAPACAPPSSSIPPGSSASPAATTSRSGATSTRCCGCSTPCRPAS